jgi:hypothetical protein
MHTRTLDFGTALKDRLKPPDRPIAQQGIHTRGYVVPDFMPKPGTHRMHDPGSIVPHIRPKVLTDNQSHEYKV